MFISKSPLGHFKSIQLMSVNSLGQVIFPSYEKYSNVSKACNDFFHKLIEVVNRIAPLKTVRKKNTSSEWSDSEIAEKLSVRDKLFKKFKLSSLNIDWEINKESRNDVQRLIQYKKKNYFEEKLTKNFTIKYMLRK